MRSNSSTMLSTWLAFGIGRRPCACSVPLPQRVSSKSTASRHRWSSARSRCRSRPTRGSKWTAASSTINRMRRKYTQCSTGASPSTQRENGERHMSVQFGRWNWDGKPVDQTYLAKVKSVIAPYSPDDEGTYTISNLSILYRAFHTTKESRCETQPHVTGSGVVITWDGRLDNRAELIRHLRDVLTISATDVSIVAAAYDEWGANCFAKLVGDWALSIWDAKSRSLLLAKDPIGTRHLYYSIDNDQVTWSTILDPLVLFAGKTFALCEEYIAGWVSLFPATHLTPYIGIHSVPPSSSVLIRSGKQTVTKYWDFDPAKRIRYATNAEYEEHFRAVRSEEH